MDPLLEAKFPMRYEAKRPEGDGRARTRYSVRRTAEEGGSGAPELGVGACLVTQPISRMRQLQAAFETVDTRGTGGRMDWRGLKQLMVAAGLPVSDKAAKQMIAEADVDGDGRLTVDEFVRQLKIA